MKRRHLAIPSDRSPGVGSHHSHTAVKFECYVATPCFPATLKENTTNLFGAMAFLKEDFYEK